MPVLKSKAYTAQQAIENALNYIEDKDKTGILDWERFLGAKSSDALLQNAMNYSANPNKTNLHSDSGQEEQLVSGYRCRLDLAKETFERTRAQYYRNGHRESVGHHYKVKTLLRPLRNPDGSYVLDADGKMVHDETEKSPVYHDAEGNPITFIQDRDTMDMLQAMRDMSDRLSQKYGLPIIVEPENAHSRSYSEWKLAKEGKSWKDMIRQDITYALEHSVSYKETLSRMKQLGYTLRETEEHITYYTPGKEHRCRDIGLGKEYSKPQVMRFFDASLPSQSLSITEEIIDPAATWGQRKAYRIYISRYTASGRRRSDLEMLLLKAIKILKLLGDRFSHVEKASQNPIHQSASWKIDRLQESISILNAHSIDTMEELNQRQAIAQKTLASTFSQLADKPLPDALAEKIGQLHLPISPKQISLAEGIHLIAYYGEYPLEFAPAKRNDRQVSPSKAAQLKELLSPKGKQLNIPVEQLNKQDADQLFTNLLLSGITPNTINKINEQEWENSLWQLSYEQRQAMTEYRVGKNIQIGLFAFLSNCWKN